MFFNCKNAKKIKNKFDLLMLQVFFHRELHSTKGVKFLLKRNGICSSVFVYEKNC